MGRNHYQDQTGPRRKKKGKGIVVLVVILLILALAAIGTGAFLILRNTPARRFQRQMDLGNRYLSELQYDRAIEAFWAASDIDPKSPGPYQGLIEAYYAKGDADAIEKVCEQARVNLSASDFNALEGTASARIALLGGSTAPSLTSPDTGEGTGGEAPGTGLVDYETMITNAMETGDYAEAERLLEQAEGALSAEQVENLRSIRDGMTRLITARTGSDGTVMTYEYDAAGRLVKTVEGERIHEYEYDGAGNLIAEYAYSDWNGDLYWEYMKGYAYDAQGRLSAETYDGVAEQFAMEGFNTAAGRPWSKEDVFTFPMVEYTYDAEGKIVSRGDMAYIYDAAGRLLSRQDNNGNRDVYTYDESGNLQSVLTERRGGFDNSVSHTETVYDTFGYEVSRKTWYDNDVTGYEVTWQNEYELRRDLVQ